MKTFYIVGLTTAIGLMAACGDSKVLTAERAKALAQARLDMTNQGGVVVNVGTLTSQLNTRTLQTPEQLLPSMKRLLDHGYIEQKSYKIIYPDLSGTYTGGWAYPQFSRGIGIRVTLSTDQSRPPNVTGSYTAECGEFDRGALKRRFDCGTGSLAGSLGRQPPYILNPSNHRAFSVWPEELGSFSLMSITLQLGSSDDTLAGYFQLISGVQNPLLLTGKNSHRNIEQDEYSYNWSQTFPQTFMNGPSMLNLGHGVIDSCDNLLLGSETSASCVVKWHVDLDTPRSALMGPNRVEGTVSATFGKQPDGTWIITSLDLPATPYTGS